MRAVFAILCSTFLFASLLALAPPGAAEVATRPSGNEVTAHLQDMLCGEASGHAACQLVAAGSSDLLALAAASGSTLFAITPVTSPGRSFPPRTPPPRQRS